MRRILPVPSAARSVSRRKPIRRCCRCRLLRRWRQCGAAFAGARCSGPRPQAWCCLASGLASPIWPKTCLLAAKALVSSALALRLLPHWARLYGGRLGALGMIRLMRHVIAHLAITGGMAASDSLVQQVLGHGIAAKLSQRLGEGILNGLLTARLGLAAIDVTRPLPFTALPRPALGDLAKDLLRKRQAEE